jgi:hypothetical protein
MWSTSDSRCAASTDAIQGMGGGATGEAGREERGGPEPEALRADDQLADRSPAAPPRAACDTWPGPASSSERVNGLRRTRTRR